MLPEGELIFTYKCYAFVLILFSLLSLSMSPIQGVVWMNHWNSIFLDQFFASITNLGNGLILIPFLVILSLKRFYLSLALIVNGVVQGIVVSIFKQVLFPGAKRPIHYLDIDSVHLVSGVDIHGSMSFPSGHTVTIFGLCIFLSLCYKNKVLSFVLVCLATLVGLSRVYLLQHFLLDVTVGAVIGTSVGILVFHFFENMNKPTWMSHRLKFRLKANRANPKFN
jgi:membrane-associated phospholipid phosphatase